MRISKLLSVVCAAAFLTGSLAVRAQDNPAQAAARAALMDKMRALDVQQNQPTNPAPPASVVIVPSVGQERAVQPTIATPKVEPTPKAADDDMVMTPVNTPVSKAEKTAAATKAKQEADQAAADLKAKKEAERKAAKQKAADEAAAKAKAKADAKQAAAELKAKKEAEATAKAQSRATVAAPSADNSGFTPVPPPSNPGGQAGTPQEQIQRTVSKLDQVTAATPQPPVVATPPAKPAAPVVAPAVKAPAKPVKPRVAPVVKPPPAKPVKPQTTPVVKPPPPANGSYAGKTLGLKPIDVPPPPVSAKKEAELQALLAKYMADQVTPEEYQKARAAILAEP
jgi:hypothetical protein